MTARPDPAINPFQHGATLIELIITIVIISVALSGLMMVVNKTVQHSADPVIQQQAIAIANSYLEEIMLLPVTVHPDTSVANDRSTYDNIADYNGLNDNGAKDQNGQAITGLENYTVSVTVANQAISGIPMKKIKVMVHYPGFETITLTGFRADY